MEQKRQKRPHAALLLPLGVAMLALHAADLLHGTAADTGFVTAGSIWLRYALWWAALLLPYLAARRAAPQPLALTDTCPPLGVCMLLSGLALMASGAACLPSVRYLLVTPEAASAYPTYAAAADALAPLLGGLWLVLYGVRAFTGFGVQRGKLGSPLFALLLPLCFLWRLVWRFQFVPASLDRLPCTLRVMSAAAALLFAVVLLKIFLVPGLPCGRTLYAAGLGCFLLCTGLELPQTVFEALHGMLALPDLLQGLGIGLFGLCGLVCAWCACGQSAE